MRTRRLLLLGLGSIALALLLAPPARACVNPYCPNDCDDGIIFQSRDDRVSVRQGAEAGVTSWNAYIGDLEVLRATDQYTQAPGSNPLASRLCGLATTSAPDPAVPGPGGVSFSLVTGVCGGSEGSLGTDSQGEERPNANPCP